MSGVNRVPDLIGHPFAATGRGEDIRCVFRACRAAGLTLPVYDVYALERQRDPDIAADIGDHLADDLSSTINLFLLNGDEVEQCLAHLGPKLLSSAYNIVYPQWELGNYPREWAGQLQRFDEIWAPSRFVFGAIRGSTAKPVLYMPLSVEVQITSFLGRRFFGIPESSYVFLFLFDFRSYIDRKNPLGIVEAFNKLCSERPREDVRLVIKVNGSRTSIRNEAECRQFLDEIGRGQQKGKVIVLDKVYTDNEVKNLIRCSNCFISLHRSEGFGRGMAEAMFLGKPVVATRYSGNLDFMNEENSCLVRCELINVRKGQYPQAEGQVWADPDIDHAVDYMLKLVDDRGYGRQLGEIASRHIIKYFSHRAIGLKYRKQLEGILGTSHVIARQDLPQPVFPPAGRAGASSPLFFKY